MQANVRLNCGPRAKAESLGTFEWNVDITPSPPSREGVGAHPEHCKRFWWNLGIAGGHVGIKKGLKMVYGKQQQARNGDRVSCLLLSVVWIGFVWEGDPQVDVRQRKTKYCI